MTDLIIIDDTLPIQGCHFAVKTDRSQIKTSVLGARYIAEIMQLGLGGVGIISAIVENSAGFWRRLSRVDALVELARRRLKSDLWKQEFERDGGILEPVSPGGA